ncbi:MFS transporter [Streptomyces gulbargensis]|uniref:MFS transporter n=1 Tax=Streptomyces gulbargensis TaxID=364901 RepID=A0ABP7N0J4_9ACTN
MTPLARLLTASQFAFNAGFYAVLPYLAGHLTGALGLGGALVGLVLGLRTFSQQGLFVIGGALTDRFGPRPVVLTGVTLRIAGFVWLAYATSAWTVTGAVVLVGFAAALFSPAVESEMAREALRAERAGGPRRTRTLARFSAGGQAGALLGPVLGTLLVYGAGDASFRAACLVGAALFALVLAAHARLMPRGGGTRERHGTVRRRAILRDRRFLRLALAYSVYLLLHNQLYLALPAELDRVTGSQAALGWFFALSSALVVLGSGPLERRAAAVLDAPAMVRAGLLLLAAAFAAGAALRPLGGPGAALTLTVLLTLGQMLILPATRALLPDLVPAAHLGLATGALSSLAGLTVLAASPPTATLLTLPGPTPWLLLAALPVLAIPAVPSAPAVTAKALTRT